MKYNKYKKFAGAICLVAAATNVIPYNVLSKPIIVMAATQEETENAEVIDISGSEGIVNGVKIVSIDHSGKFILKGNNHIPLTQGADGEEGDVFIDTQIVVIEGVTVELYLDENFAITNDNGVLEEIGGGPAISGGIPTSAVQSIKGETSPLVINGTANIHICGNTTLESVNKIVTVNGTMNIIESENDAVLTLGLYDKQSVDVKTFNCFAGEGTISILDGNVIVDTHCRDNCAFKIGAKLNISGGFFDWQGQGETDSPVIINGGYISSQTNMKSVKNSSGQTLSARNLTGLPDSQPVLQMNRTKQTATSTNADGILKTYLPKDQENVIYIGNLAYTYSANSDELVGEPLNSHSIRLIDSNTGEEIDSYLIRDNDKVKLLQSDQWNYTYTCEGQEVTQDTAVTNDMVISVSKEIKKFNVIIDNDTDNIQRIAYGEPISDSKVYYELKDGDCKIYYPGDIVTQDLNLTSIDLQLENQSLLIGTPEDLNKFASLVNAGVTNVNGRLTADIVASNDYEQIGKCTKSSNNGYEYKKYIGTFDGQGHHVEIHINRSEQDYNGFIGVAGDGAIIKNLIVDGTVVGGYATGGIVGGSREYGIITIENCMNYATVTGNGTDAAGIIGTNGNGEATLHITNCANIGDIKSVNYTQAITGWSGNGAEITNCYNKGVIENTGASEMPDYSFIRGNFMKITNCYQIDTNVKRKLTGLETVSAEQLASGEVAYMLNGKNNNSPVIWYQTCGADYPILNGDANTQTVYKGYEDCTSETQVLTNKKHLQQGHQYTYTLNKENPANVVVTIGCEFCDAVPAATAVLTPDACEYDGKTHGVAIQYSSEWEAQHLPDLIVKYAYTENGVYKTDAPVITGTWYAKLYLDETTEACEEAFSYKIAPKQYGVTVMNGTGAGNYAEGSSVSVNAETTLGTKKFKNWTVVSGPAVTFADANSASTTFIMPSQDITVQANYVETTTSDPGSTPSGDPGSTPSGGSSSTPSGGSTNPTDNNSTSQTTSTSDNTSIFTESRPDGTKITMTTTVDNDGSKVVTQSQVNPDGSTIDTIIKTTKDNQVTKNVTEKKKDGTVINTEVKPDGSSTCDTSFKDERIHSVIAVFTMKDKNGKITSTKTGITTQGTENAGKTRIMISGSVLDKVKEYAGTDKMDIVMNVADNDGNGLYHLTFSSTDFNAGTQLNIYRQNDDGKASITTNLKKVTVTKNGGLVLNIPVTEKDLGYQLVNNIEAKAINQAILSTVTVKKSKVSISSGKKTKIALGSDLNMENVAKITYTSADNSVATVNKNGVVTSKKKGTVTINVKVVLNNKQTKTVKTKVVVK